MAPAAGGGPVSAQLDLMTSVPLVACSFEGIARAVLCRGHGITLDQLRSVGALSRECEKETPDPERVGWLARELGLDPDDLGAP